MANIIFPMNRLKHRSWSNRLRRLLDGQIDKIDDSFKNTHENCALGKWYYSDGQKELGNISEFKEMEDYHKKFHILVHDIVKLKETGKIEEAEESFTQLGEIAEKILFFLDILEKKSEEMETQKAATG